MIDVDVNQHFRIQVLNLDYLKCFSELLRDTGKHALHHFRDWFTVHVMAPFLTQGLAVLVDGGFKTAKKMAKFRCVWLTEHLMDHTLYTGFSNFHRYAEIKEGVLGVVNNIRRVHLQRII